jgi:hypothetical protein
MTTVDKLQAAANAKMQMSSSVSTVGGGDKSWWGVAALETVREAEAAEVWVDMNILNAEVKVCKRSPVLSAVELVSVATIAALGPDHPQCVRRLSGIGGCSECLVLFGSIR